MPIKLIAKVATHPLADSPVVVILSCVAVICAMLLLAIGPSVSQQQKSRKQPLKMWISLQNVRVGINGVSVDADIIIKNNNQKPVTLNSIMLYFTENAEIHALDVTVYGATLPAELKPYQELDLGLNSLANRPLMEGIESEAWALCEIDGQSLESRHTLFTM
ncbi:hypothetical protein CMK14_05015 [Candidatus Poribacteria bacterium]|nr:hypothetical protein [Candidatus Poribacteria bacterium]